MILVISDEKRLVIYPCRNATLINAIAIHDDTLSQKVQEGWSADASTVEDLKNAFSDFAPVYHRLFEAGEDIKLWQLLDHVPISTWIKGRVCLLGDACHPMLPRMTPIACNKQNM